MKNIKDDWKEVRLGDIAKYYNKKISRNLVTKYNYISTENLLPNIKGKVNANSIPDTDKLHSYLKNHILISNIRPYFKKIWFAKTDGGCSSDILVFEANDNIYPKYLYYIMSQNIFFDYIMSGSNGTKMPRGDKKHILNFNFLLPPLEKQKKISSILSSLDNKIELNNSINKILEEIANTIFKEWFINFNFPDENGKPYKKNGGKIIKSRLGEIPENWSIATIGRYCKIKSGFAFKSSWWKNKGIPVIKIQNVSSENINIEDCSFVDEDKYKLAEMFRVNEGDLLIAMTGATLGKFSIVPKLEKDALVNQRVGKFFLGNEPIKKLPFIYSLLKSNKISNTIISLGKGSAQPNISTSDIENIKIVYPNESIINKYNTYMKDIFIKILNSKEENQKLISIRDSILSKLINGKIRIK